MRLNWKNAYGLLLSFLLLIFANCEKVIEIPIEDEESQIVVEAVTKSLEGESYVLLSKTIGFYDEATSVEKLSGASVQIVGQDGAVFIFDEDPDVPGRYGHPTFKALPNYSYDLTVIYNDVVLTANSNSLTVPQIDSLFVYQNIDGTDTNNVLLYTVTDNPIEKNYYRFVLWVNGEKENAIFIETDDLGNGETYTSPFFGVSYNSNDSIYGELWSMNKDNYAYFSALYTNLNQSPFSATPSDLPSNIEGGKGYFGVFMVDTVSIIIP